MEKIVLKEKDSIVVFNDEEVRLLNDVKDHDKIKDTGTIKGIFFSKDNKVVATDARRLIILEKNINKKFGDVIIDFDCKVKKEHSLIINFEKEKFYICGENDFEIKGKILEIEKFENHSFKKIEGQFPDYKQVIPKNNPVYRSNFYSSYIPKNLRITLDLPEGGTTAIQCELNSFSGFSEDNSDRKIKDVFYLFMPVRSKNDVETGLLKEELCEINGCENRKNDGKFIDTICSPCHEYLKNKKKGNSQAERNIKQLKLLREFLQKK